jgi:hypothetical protein
MFDGQDFALFGRKVKRRKWPAAQEKIIAAIKQTNGGNFSGQERR